MITGSGEPAEVRWLVGRAATTRSPPARVVELVALELVVVGAAAGVGR